MKRTSCTVCLLLLSLVMAGNAFAGSGEGKFNSGDKEVSIMGSHSATDLNVGSDLRLTSLSGAYGWFLSDVAEMAIKGSVFSASVGAADLSLYGVGADMKYHYPMQGFIPYFGAQFLFIGSCIEYGAYESNVTGSLYGPLAGIKYFLSDTTIFTIEYQYQLLNGDEIELVLDEISQLSVGLSVKF